MSSTTVKAQHTKTQLLILVCQHNLVHDYMVHPVLFRLSTHSIYLGPTGSERQKSELHIAYLNSPFEVPTARSSIYLTLAMYRVSQVS